MRLLGRTMDAVTQLDAERSTRDDARVLNATTGQNDAANLPVGVYIWTTTQDAASSKPAFDTDVRNKISAAFPVAIGSTPRRDTSRSRSARAPDYPRARRCRRRSGHLSTRQPAHQPRRGQG
jgi:hypothetical protein